MEKQEREGRKGGGVRGEQKKGMKKQEREGRKGGGVRGEQKKRGDEKAGKRERKGGGVGGMRKITVREELRGFLLLVLNWNFLANFSKISLQETKTERY